MENLHFSFIFLHFLLPSFPRNYPLLFAQICSKPLSINALHALCIRNAVGDSARGLHAEEEGFGAEEREEGEEGEEGEGGKDEGLEVAEESGEAGEQGEAE